MPRVKKGAVKEKIVIPEVKENMTKEESQAIIDFFNKFTVHLLLSRKPSQEVMARSKVRFKRAEQKVFSKPYSFYEDYFVGLSNSFFTKEIDLSKFNSRIKSILSSKQQKRIME